MPADWAQRLHRVYQRVRQLWLIDREERETIEKRADSVPTLVLHQSQMHCQQKMCPHGVAVAVLHGFRHIAQFGLSQHTPSSTNDLLFGQTVSRTQHDRVSSSCGGRTLPLLLHLLHHLHRSACPGSPQLLQSSRFPGHGPPEGFSLCTTLSKRSRRERQAAAAAGCQGN